MHEGILWYVLTRLLDPLEYSYDDDDDKDEEDDDIDNDEGARLLPSRENAFSLPGSPLVDPNLREDLIK